MRKLQLATLSLLLSTSVAFAADSTPTASPIPLTDNASKVSYGIGLNIGSSLQAQGLQDINLDALMLGVKDVLGNQPLKVSEDDLSQAFTALQAEHEAKNAELAKKNLEAAKSFLAENKKANGVITTSSGLQYKVLAEGKGPKPKKDDIVSTHYRGTLIDGTEFDSSYTRNQPIEFPVDRVIPGWTEALQLMPVGSKWLLFVPPELGYGEKSPTAQIPPNSLLIFEVELLGIKAQSTAATQSSAPATAAPTVDAAAKTTTP